MDYFEVTDSQRTELAAQRARAQIEGQRLYASVRLVKALGGGWDASALGAEQPAPYPVLPLDSAAPQPDSTSAPVPPTPQS